MRLEDEIKQKSFKDEYHKASVNVIFTSNWLGQIYDQFFKQHDITSQQYNILRILKGAEGPLSTLQIRSRMLDRMSDTSRIVDRLVIKGLVCKKLCSADKRLVDVNITDEGKKMLLRMIEY